METECVLYQNGRRFDTKRKGTIGLAHGHEGSGVAGAEAMNDVEDCLNRNYH